LDDHLDDGLPTFAWASITAFAGLSWGKLL
jgi:hypothetical protein